VVGATLSKGFLLMHCAKLTRAKLGFCVYFFPIFRFWPSPSAFERTLIYRIVSYRIVTARLLSSSDVGRQFDERSPIDLPVKKTRHCKI